MSARWTRALKSLLPSSGDLHVCPACAGDFVNPLGWEESGTARWTVTLRCGACGHIGAHEVSPGQAKRFDHALDRGYDAISLAADRLAHERMASWVDTFAAALQRDLIDVADFAGRQRPA